MIPLCLVLGDSTAVGTAQALAAQGFRCTVHAREGAPSTETVRTWRTSLFTERALIALGSNDALNPDLAANLLVLRRRVSATRVTWLAPYHPRAAAAVAEVAAQFGDDVVHLGRFSSKDRVHPKSYRVVASALQWQIPASAAYRFSTVRSAPTPTPRATTAIRQAVVLSF